MAGCSFRSEPARPARGGLLGWPRLPWGGNMSISLGMAIERLRDSLASAYDIDREIGRGGMSVVLLAHDRKHDRVVAIKVLHPELAANLGPERFLREIKLV